MIIKTCEFVTLYTNIDGCSTPVFMCVSSRESVVSSTKRVGPCTRRSCSTCVHVRGAALNRRTAVFANHLAAPIMSGSSQAFKKRKANWPQHPFSPHRSSLAFHCRLYGAKTLRMKLISSPQPVDPTLLQLSRTSLHHSFLTHHRSLLDRRV